MLGQKVPDPGMRLHGLSPVRTFLINGDDTIAEVSDRQLVSHPQPPEFYPIAIDANAISAAEVADDDLTLLLESGSNDDATTEANGDTRHTMGAGPPRPSVGLSECLGPRRGPRVARTLREILHEGRQMRSWGNSPHIAYS